MIAEKKTLASVLLLVCISYIGVALPYPILAPTFLNGEHTALSTFHQFSPEVLLGFVLACYPLGMALGGHIMGAMADHFGRKSVLTWSLLGGSVGYVLSGYALMTQHYPLLLASRLITGMFEGNISIARSIAADLSPVIPKTTSFSYIHAAVYVGYLIGPIISGVLLYFTDAMPFYFAALLNVCGMLLIIKTFNETWKPTQKETGLSRFNAWKIFKQPGVLVVCIINLLSALAFSIFYQFYPLYLVKIYGFGSDGITLLTVVLTFALIFSSLVVVKLSKRLLSLHNNIILSLMGYLTLALIMVNADSMAIFVVSFTLLGIFIVTSGTHIGVFVSDLTSVDDQGKLMGILATLSASGTVLSILAGSWLATLSPYYPMMMSIICALASLLIFLSIMRKPYSFQHNELPVEPSPGHIDDNN